MMYPPIPNGLIAVKLRPSGTLYHLAFSGPENEQHRYDTLCRVGSLSEFPAAQVVRLRIPHRLGEHIRFRGTRPRLCARCARALPVPLYTENRITGSGSNYILGISQKPKTKDQFFIHVENRKPKLVVLSELPHGAARGRLLSFYEDVVRARIFPEPEAEEPKAHSLPSYIDLREWLQEARERSLLPAHLEEFLVECGVPSTPHIDFYVHTWENLVLEDHAYVHPTPRKGDKVRISKGDFIHDGDSIVEGTVLLVVHDIWTEGKRSHISILIEPSEVSTTTEKD